VYGTTFDSTGVESSIIPGWFYFLFAMAYFLYRLFDEADGKQARRTGNSSPLGMLFDHGCDAFIMTFVLAVTAKCMNFGNNIHTIIWFSISLSLFYFAQLEEYYVGGMILGLFNPVSDGSFIAYSLFISFGIWGN
jgi:phosphatidylglycerophosphate synthase